MSSRPSSALCRDALRSTQPFAQRDIGCATVIAKLGTFTVRATSTLVDFVS
ncbi:MAG: hypothetical protein ACFFAE_08715 [Candidatus Hodarchaeota archaeon]